MIRVADYVVRFLEDYGVEDIFTVSGGGSIFLCDAVANAKTLEDVDGLVAEFHDRLGLKLPDETHYLFYYARVKILARMARADAVVRQRDHIKIQLKSPVGDARLALEKALGHGIKVGNQQIHMDAQIGNGPWGQALIELLRGVAEFNNRLDRLMTVAT